MKDVTLSIAPDAVRGLIGEDGLGKSTLAPAFAGHLAPSTGSFAVDCRPVRPGEPRAALAAGIRMVHQHSHLAGDFGASENAALRRPTSNLDGRREDLHARMTALGARHGLVVDLDRPLSQLSVCEQQRVEMPKALIDDVRLLILDEPTAVLTPAGADHLAGVIRGLAA